jgi:tripartite-type tricarboxylate transporter receptor subunit TctC
MEKEGKDMKSDGRIVGRMLLGFLVIVLACAVPISGQAQDAARFYKGKTLTFLVTVGPGGGFDMYARMIAPFLEKETGASVIVHNMVGGEGYIALRHLYNAKPDGLNIILTGGSKVTLNQIFGDPRAKGMDIKRFVWLARVVHEPCVLMLSTKFPYRSLNDLKGAKHTITSGTASSLSNQHLALAILAEAIGLDAKIVVGFSGTVPGRHERRAKCVYDIRRQCCGICEAARAFSSGDCQFVKGKAFSQSSGH